MFAFSFISPSSIPLRLNKNKFCFDLRVLFLLFRVFLGQRIRLLRHCRLPPAGDTEASSHFITRLFRYTSLPNPHRHLATLTSLPFTTSPAEDADLDHPFTLCDDRYNPKRERTPNVNVQGMKCMPWYNTPLTKALACAAPWDAVLTILRSDPEAAKAADPRTGMSLLDLLNGFFPPFPKDDYPTHAVAASHIVSASMSNTYQECITHLLQGDALTVHTFSVWWDEVWGEAEDADARAATKAACGEVDANGATLLFHAMQNGAPTEVILNLLSANPDAAKVAFTPKTYGPFAIVDDTDYTTYPLADALARTYNCFNPEYLNHFDDEVVLAIVEAWPHIPTATAMLRLAVERERSLRVIRGLLLALPPSCVFEKYDIGRLGEEHGVGRGYNFALSEILCGGRLDVVQYLTS